MRWVVVLVETDYVMGTGKVKTFGPYASAELAEAARRRVHFGARQTVKPWQDFSQRAPRTYVAKLETERPSEGPRFVAVPTGDQDDQGNSGYTVQDNHTGETEASYSPGFFAGQDARSYADQLNGESGR